jgi:hypothetical protein
MSETKTKGESEDVKVRVMMRKIPTSKHSFSPFDVCMILLSESLASVLVPAQERLF